MKIINILSLATIAFALEASAVTTATLSLKDGSTLKAELKTEKIACSTLFAKALGLEPAIVKSISFNGKEGEAKVELTNGNKLTASIENPSFKVSSMLGELDIPKAIIRSMTLTTREGVAPGAGDGLVFHCTFDDEAAVTSPAVGPAGKLELGTIAQGRGKEGNGALLVQPGVAGAHFEFPAGTFGKEGTIEFWAKFESGKTEFSSGGDPRFLVLATSDGREFGGFEFASNDGAGNSGLCATYAGIHCFSKTGYSYMMAYSDVFKGEDFNGWHHYEMVWTAERISAYIDDKRISVREGTIDFPTIERLAQMSVFLDVPLNRTWGKSFNNKSAFLMDELKVYNYAREPVEL